MDRKTKKMLTDRRELFIEEGGRTPVWKAEKKRTDEAVKNKKRVYYEKQKEGLLAEDASRNFYRLIKSFGSAEKPKLFDVRDLLPDGISDVLRSQIPI